MILILLLFQLTVGREVTRAIWLEKPIPHWSCKAGTFPVENPDSFMAPYCIAPPRSSMITYNVNSQEMISFEREIVLDSDGIGTLIWEPFWTRMPGCAWTGDEKHRVQVLEQTGKRLVFRGQARQVLHGKCQGIIDRKREDKP